MTRDVDPLLREWDAVTSTARRPEAAPRASAAGATVRARFGVPGLAATVIAVVALLVVLPRFASGPSDRDADPGGGGVALTTSDTSEDCGIRVTLTTDRSRYLPADSIDAALTVVYDGPEPSVVIHGATSPVGFSVQEVGGDRSAPGGIRTVARDFTFVRGEPQVFPWEKSGSFDATAPGHDFVRDDYLRVTDGQAAPDLRLPVGTWELRAGLLQPRNGCEGDGRYRVAVRIRVDDPQVAHGSRTAEAPSAQAPSATPDPTLAWAPPVECGLPIADCDHVVALAEAAGSPRLAEVGAIIVADVCAPTVLCDRRWPFDSLVVFTLPLGGWGQGWLAWEVVGERGPERVEREWTDALPPHVGTLLERARSGEARLDLDGVDVRCGPVPEGLCRRTAAALVADMTAQYPGRTVASVTFRHGGGHDVTFTDGTMVSAIP